MTHALTRTSPKGGPFIGRCDKCGQDGLGIGAPLEPCPMDVVVSDEQALLDCLEQEFDSAALAQAQPSEYERKVAQMKDDFPNGI